VRIVQLVRLLRKDEPVKMSKRAADFATLREVIDEVGRDAWQLIPDFWPPQWQQKSPTGFAFYHFDVASSFHRLWK
jgi:hypothetical protein